MKNLKTQFAMTSDFNNNEPYTVEDVLSKFFQRETISMWEVTKVESTHHGDSDFKVGIDMTATFPQFGGQNSPSVRVWGSFPMHLSGSGKPSFGWACKPSESDPKELGLIIDLEKPSGEKDRLEIGPEVHPEGQEFGVNCWDDGIGKLIIRIWSRECMLAQFPE